MKSHIPEMQNVITILDDAMKELKESSKMHGSIEKVIFSVKSLLTEEDKSLSLPITVKRKIKKLITFTVEDHTLYEYRGPFSFLYGTVKMPMNEYRRRCILLAMDIVVFIHSYK
jgi:hypothetical protein